MTTVGHKRSVVVWSTPSSKKLQQRRRELSTKTKRHQTSGKPVSSSVVADVQESLQVKTNKREDMKNKMVWLLICGHLSVTAGWGGFLGETRVKHDFGNIQLPVSDLPSVWKVDSQAKIDHGLALSHDVSLPKPESGCQPEEVVSRSHLPKGALSDLGVEQMRLTRAVLNPRASSGVTMPLISPHAANKPFPRPRVTGTIYALVTDGHAIRPAQVAIMHRQTALC
ncbi:unnamed protein product [Protopolystoma xenopodis]|uniref:Uncharacterized protein n=1 Tax=Protopolystoma xenopodis TaxID=117903 RepID=A0A448XDL9_9PLAT|nr:unnamed protein product [Protopolystoma xenopodis]